MTTAVIVDAVRTAGGKRHGKLSGWHPVDLAAETLQGAGRAQRPGPGPDRRRDHGLRHAGRAPRRVNVGRNAVLAAGFPESVPATTIDRQCGSSQQAVHFAAQGVMAGAIRRGRSPPGVEVMSLVPDGRQPIGAGVGLPFGPTVGQRYGRSAAWCPRASRPR